MPFPVLRGNPPPPSRPSANPSRAPANPFVPLRGPSWPFVEIFLPFLPAFDGLLPDLRQTPPAPPANPFAPLCRSSWPFVEIFLPFSFPPLTAPFPTLGGSLSSPRQPLRGPSPFFVALRGNLFVFFLPAFDGPLPDLRRPPLDPPPTPSCPFPWKSFCLSSPPLTAPFPTLGGSLSSPRQPLRAPSPFFVPLRGNLFAFFLPAFDGPLPDPWRIPIEPPPTP